MYAWLLFAHLLGVALLLLALGVYIVSIEYFRRAQTVAELRLLDAVARLGERILFVAGPLLLGGGLALAARFWSFSRGWIATSIALVVWQGVLAALVVEPRMRRMRSALLRAPDGTPSADLAALANDRVIHAANRASVVVILEILFLMSVKPAAPGILASLLVAVALAAVACWPFLAGSAGRSLSAPGR